MHKGHGGNLREAANSAGVAPEALTDFSASVYHPIKIDTLRQWLADAAGALGAYPDPDYSVLRERIASRYSLEPRAIIPGNGSTELLYLIPRALKPRRALIVSPSYADYADAMRVAGADIHRFMLEKGNGFRLSLDRLAEKLDEGFDMAVIGNPNNPTGTSTDAGSLRRFIDAHPRTLFLIDESFTDFAPHLSLFPLIPANAVVVRSFTKFYGIPGLRAGYAVAEPAIAARLIAGKEPWTLSVPAEQICLRLLNGAVDESAIIAALNTTRTKMMVELSRISGIAVHASPANFVLVEITSAAFTAAQIRERLLVEKHMLVRDCANFTGLGPYWFRTAVRQSDENALLAAAIESLLCTPSL